MLTTEHLVTYETVNVTTCYNASRRSSGHENDGRVGYRGRSGPGHGRP